MSVRLGLPTKLPIDPWWVDDVGPSRMRVTSPFGERTINGRKVFHGGLDIGNAREGDAVVAVADGIVLAAGYLVAPWSTPDARYPSGNTGGMMVILELAPGIVVIYAHMRPNLEARAGDVLTAGDLIGFVGSTGAAAPPPAGGGAHLHLSVQVADVGMVPAGVATRATHYGIGIDVDPWPLITGAALLEELMNTPAGGRALIAGTVGAGNRLRIDPNTTEGSEILGDSIGDPGVAREVQVLLSGVSGEPYVLGGKSGDEYLWIGTFGRTWYVARPLVTDLRLKGEGEALASDCAPLEAKLGAALRATEGALQAVTVARDRLAE